MTGLEEAVEAAAEKLRLRYGGLADDDLQFPGYLNAIARYALKAAAPILAAQVRAEVADVFEAHYLAAVVCDTDRHMDNPRCACSLIDLGWHQSVGAAVHAWREHVEDVIAREHAQPPPTDSG